MRRGVVPVAGEYRLVYVVHLMVALSPHKQLRLLQGILAVANPAWVRFTSPDAQVRGSVLEAHIPVADIFCVY